MNSECNSEEWRIILISLISKYLTQLEHFCYETLYEGNREKKDPQ